MEVPPKHRDPFEFMKISDNRCLDGLSGRSPCIKCGKSRKFFCYTCHLPSAEVAPLLPKVQVRNRIHLLLLIKYLLCLFNYLQLPLKIDIIKHPHEKDGKSTAIHAAILASADVSIHTYPDIPDYDDDPDGGLVSVFLFNFSHFRPQISNFQMVFAPSKQILIFPSNDSEHMHGIFDAHRRLQSFDKLSNGGNKSTLLKSKRDELKSEEQLPTGPRDYTLNNLPIKRAVFIDSTWDQSKGIFKDARINKLRPVVLQHRLTQFWRHQRNSPRWFLATIEGRLKTILLKMVPTDFFSFQQFTNS